MNFSPSTKLGTYEIIEAIGAGGMAEVYKALDTKLGRDVAIKVLPKAFTKDRERRARFEREARIVASLNHPNIAAIYGLEERDGVHFLVLEYVPGETLADRIARGAITLEEALDIFKQITEALEAAHEKGIVHRDLKPSNIMIKPEGVVKVMDFGLAKAFQEESPASVQSESPTLTREGTRTGVVMGTAPYMSPEQARGRTVDKRTDVWAFGCCLYEALTGRRAFLGETISDTMAKVLEREPDWEALPPSLPVSIRSLLRRCLQKEHSRRLRDVGDARLEMQEVHTLELPGVEPTARPQGWRGTAPYVATAVFAIIAISQFVSESPSSSPEGGLVSRTTISLPQGQRQPRSTFAPLAISPDGTLLAYVAQDGTGLHLFLRPLDSFESRKIPGTEDASMPFFSPDGRWVGFFAASKLKKVLVASGSPLTITNAPRAPGPAGELMTPSSTLLASIPASGRSRRKALLRSS